MKKKTAQLGLCTACAMMLGYVESLVPVLFFVPGMKLGLANLAIVLALYKLGEKEAFLVQIVRILLVGFLFGNLFSILFSLVGGLCSLSVMCLAKRCGRFTVYGVSIAGGVTHNLAQLCVAAGVVGSTAVVFYFPVLVLTGLTTGLLIGLLSCEMMKRLGNGL